MLTSTTISRMMRLLSPLALPPVLALVLSGSLVVCYSDPDVTVNCSSTGYPVVLCSAPANTVILDLSYNHMEKIPAGCFPSLTKLKRLLLQFNSISTVDPNAFQHNPVLEYLDISHNLLPQISALPFTSLPALTYLDISNNAYEDILLEQSFDPHGRLQSLKLGSSHSVSVRKNHVKRLEDLHLKHIHLVVGNITEYEPGSLLVLKHIDMITVNTEYSQDLTKHMGMLIDTCKSLNTLTIMKLDLRKSNLVIPIHDILQTMTILRLIVKDLKVSGTFCEFIPYSLKSSIEQMDFHNIHGEGVCYLKVGTFDRCHLRKLSFSGIGNKDFLYFFPQPAIPKVMACLTDMSATDYGARYFPCAFSVFLINLKTLNVSINELTEESILSFCHSPFPKLQSLAIDHNKFQHLGILGNKTAHMKYLVNFTASYNQVRLEPQTVFINWTKSLRRLNLRSNQLTDDALQFLPKTLEMLDVSYNNIYTVTHLQAMRDLQELFLTGNKITTLYSELLPSSVHLLYVDRNSMKTISVATIRFLNLAELDFSRNPLHCDCDTLQLAQFCRDSSKTEILGWPSGYRCQSPDSLMNETLEQLSLPWVPCHKGSFAVIILCCLCLPIACYWLVKRLRIQMPYFSQDAFYGAILENAARTTVL